MEKIQKNNTIEKSLFKMPPPCFLFYKEKMEREIVKSISFFGEKNALSDACAYALTNGGKRLRPILVLMISDALGYGLDATKSALSVEFFHTASLIADDLPCMDNDDIRRDKPSLHKVFGETVALLASYAFITAGFEHIYLNSYSMKNGSPPFCLHSDHVCVAALEAASRCSGINGATGGQFLDLFPPSLSLKSIREGIYKKTITLFEVAFVFGWLFGGGEKEKLEQVKQAAFHLGLAFQIADDLQDMEQDQKKEKGINILSLLEKKEAFLLFQQELTSFSHKLKELGIYTPSFEELEEILRGCYKIHFP